MSKINKKDKENIVTNNLMSMLVNLYVFEVEKKVREKLDKDLEDIEKNIEESTELIEAYKEVYSEEDPEFEMPEVDQDIKNQIIDQKMNKLDKEIWDSEMSIKVFEKVGNKDRKKKSEDKLVELNKQLSIWEKEKS